MDVIAREAIQRHEKAFAKRPVDRDGLDAGGKYQWRDDGERHLFNPESIYYLQQACKTNDYGLFKKDSTMSDDQSEHLTTLRGLLEFNFGDHAIPLDEVEPVESIVRRFKDRRHVLWLNQQGSPRSLGHRYEPHRREEQHRRGR
jgi:glutamate synthase (ferredoxin)